MDREPRLSHELQDDNDWPGELGLTSSSAPRHTKMISPRTMGRGHTADDAPSTLLCGLLDVADAGTFATPYCGRRQPEDDRFHAHRHIELKRFCGEERRLLKECVEFNGPNACLKSAKDLYWCLRDEGVEHSEIEHVYEEVPDEEVKRFQRRIKIQCDNP